MVTDDYIIEAVTYESEPGSRVTASLYFPADTEMPVPAIVLACGHEGAVDYTACLQL